MRVLESMASGSALERSSLSVATPRKHARKPRGWAKLQRVKRDNEGSAGFEQHGTLSRVSPQERAILLETLAKLRRSVALETAVSELIAVKKAAGKSKRYCRDLYLRLGRRLSAPFKGKGIREISTADLNGFLGSLDVAPGTRNTFRRDILTLWRFAEKHDWADAKTAKNTEAAPKAGKSPFILSVEQARALMAESHQDNFTRTLHAIGLFAGIRVGEITKLEWKHINLAEGFINLPPEIVKGKKSRRLVPIQPNLREWLQPIAKTHGPVLDFYPRTHSRAARKRAGITQWVTHTARHCYASYRLAQIQNPAQVALECGHDQAVLFEHYRELVRPADAERFFAIRPNQESGKIVSFAA